MNNKIICISGMPRSGSTFSFNISREILSKYGDIFIIYTDSYEDVKELINKKNLLIKSHNPDHIITNLIKTGEFTCICTIRKPEDAIVSLMGVFNLDLNNSIIAIGKWLRWYHGVARYALRINYKLLDLSPFISILMIQHYITGRSNIFEAFKLWRKYNKKNIKKYCDKLEEGSNTKNVGFSYYDKETFLHRRHVSSLKSKVAQKCLTIEQINTIRQDLGDLVDKRGNINY